MHQINDTHITLIPKVKHMTRLKDFRLISLCNVFHKAITKVLSHCIRPLMEKLLGPCQVNFIPIHQSRDNVIIAQEVFHSMRHKKLQMDGCQ